MDLKQKKADGTFLRIAKEIASMSNCAKTQVGSVAVLDGRILSTGINGTPPGFPNCNELHVGDFDHAAHRLWADDYEIHAEQNTINFAAKNGIAINGATLYVTMQPCKQCTKNLITAGIKRIVYSQLYDRITPADKETAEYFLHRCGVNIEFQPAE